MNAPYNFRIMAALPGHQPVELFRTRSSYTNTYFNSYTKDISCEWDCWIESRMPDSKALGGRVKIKRHKEPQNDDEIQ